MTLLLAAGMALRLTRLTATDVITAPLRKPLSGWVLKLVTCGWCASVWISFIIVAPTWYLWRHELIWQAIALALTASWLAGVTHTWGSGTPKPVDITVTHPLVVDQVPDLDIEYDEDGDA